MFSILFQLAANDDVPSKTGRYVVIGSKLKQNANEGCNSCATVVVLCFIACFILLVIAPLTHPLKSSNTADALPRS